ncbi:MAG: S8 family serine peptidase, partial [Alphaproteobacteria bacterium]|nr:S8 family serine peptidase [Alphaproteobacteria bacterium]
TNVYIDAVRWDLASSMSYPVKALLNDRYDGNSVFAINMSVGSDADDDSNAGSNVDRYRMLQGYMEAMDAIKSKYTYHTVFGESGRKIDGTIVVKAAGNERYDQPDIESGVKLIKGYEDLLMLVVVAADVTLNSDGTVKEYTKSSFSNKCGATAGYCIAAPGGNSVTFNGNFMTSVGKPGEYSRMMGTSQATPVVTGALAFIKAAYPDMKSSEIIELVRITANTNGVGYNSNNHADATYGAGLLDLGAAVTTYIPAEGNSVTTVSGNTIDSSKIRLDNSIMSVPSGMSAALQKALPETITAFDKYRRPFDFSTASYIAQTHSGYKSFKNDVAHISPNHKIKRMEQKNMTFAYAESSAPKKGNGFMYAEYNSGKNVSGFYFSEDTKYYSENSRPADFANPFMAFNNAYGMQHTYNLNSLLGFKFEAVSGQNGIYDGDRDYRDRSFNKPAYAFNSEIQLHNNKQFALALSSGMLYEQDAMLGLNGEGAFDVADTQTYHAGVKATWFATPKITLSGSYYQGYTKGQSLAAGMLRSSNLISDSFAFDVNYKQSGSFDYGLRLSSPLRVKHGRLYVDMASGRDYDSGMVLRNRYVAGLKPERREYKFALYANKDVTDSLSWSSEFDVRLNPEHQAASAEYRALFGLSYKF